MLNTKNLLIDVHDVPSYWVFQYYLNLPEKLTGQDLKIKSVFNATEKTPSFCIYVDRNLNQYKFKDFSTGESGSKIDLVKHLFNMTYNQAVNMIISDYNIYVKSGDLELINLTPNTKWTLNHVQTREWNNQDASFWLSYRIGSTILKEYNVKPIEYFTMIKDEEGKIEQAKFNKPMTYGYFNKDGDLYKIYQPFNSDHKFYNVDSHLQGYDQLNYDKPYLVICSSLKDAMCLKSFGYNIEVVAPNSENTMIKPYLIQNFLEKYKKVITLFDNDKAGSEAIERYVKTYNINGCALNICKDISDAVKEHGFEKIHTELKPLLKTTLDK
jgi:5S rRNA maturation endonuclease (ribonuclease M5)